MVLGDLEVVVVPGVLEVSPEVVSAEVALVVVTSATVEVSTTAEVLVEETVV